MPKLIDTIESNKPFPYKEIWMSDNGLRIVISYYEEVLFLSIQNESGDVADQVYELLSQNDIFHSIKLETGSCYFIKTEKKLLEAFFEAVELIDVKKLKEGKSY